MSRKLHREISRRWFRIGAYDEQMVKNRASRSVRTAAFVAAREITPQLPIQRPERSARAERFFPALSHLRVLLASTVFPERARLHASNEKCLLEVLKVGLLA
jgi:hypothetical protein